MSDIEARNALVAAFENLGGKHPSKVRCRFSDGSMLTLTTDEAGNATLTDGFTTQKRATK